MTKNLNRKLLAATKSKKKFKEAHENRFIGINPQDILARRKAQRLEVIQNNTKQIQKERLFSRRKL